MFKHSTVPGRAKPEGGFGSHGAPAKGMRTSAPKGKPSGSPKHAAHKPSGGHGTYGKPSPKASRAQITTGNYASESSIAGKVTMKPLLNVKVPKSQRRK